MVRLGCDFSSIGDCFKQVITEYPAGPFDNGCGIDLFAKKLILHSQMGQRIHQGDVSPVITNAYLINPGQGNTYNRILMMNRSYLTAAIR